MPSKNKALIKAYQSKYRSENRERLRELQKAATKNRPGWLKAYYYIRGRCRPNGHYTKKGIKNFITRDELKTLWLRDNADSLKKPSIDRINSKGNYEFSNCRFIELSKNISTMIDEKQPIIRDVKSLRRPKQFLQTP